MDIYGIIEDYIVSQMTPTLTITAVDADGDNWKLSMCDTSWISPCDTVTINGVDYLVESFVQDESITVSGSTEPPVTTFTIGPPHYDYHHRRKVNTERQASKEYDPSNIITPFIYVAPVRNTGAPDQFSLYGFEGKVRVYFLQTFDRENDLVDTHFDDVINPMRAMADYFQAILESRTDIFDDENVSKPEEFDHPNFGAEAIWGYKESVFDEPLSGVERVFDMKVFGDIDSCCETSPENELCPDVTRSFQGTATSVDTAAGQNIDFQVWDPNDNPTGTLEYEDANTIRVRVAGTADPVSTLFNGVATGVDTPAGSTLSIGVTNSTPALVGTLVIDAATAKGITIADTDIELEGVPFANGTPAEGTLNIEIVDQDDVTVPATIITDGAALKKLEINVPSAPVNTANAYKTGQTTSYRTGDDPTRGRGDDWWNLGYINPFGNSKRFTGKTGGYQDESDSLYYDKDGVATTQALAFPDDIMLDWSQWDQVGETVLGINMNVYSQAVWNTAIDTVEASTTDGYSDWHILNKKEICIMTNDNLVGGSPILFDYHPMNYEISVQGDRLWTSTTGGITTRAYYLVENGGIQNTNKTSSASYIETRYYTYANLGL